MTQKKSPDDLPEESSIGPAPIEQVPPAEPAASPDPSVPADESAPANDSRKAFFWGAGVVVLAALIFGGGFFFGRLFSPPASPSASDIALPDVTLEQFNARLDDLRGSPVMVNFWASWCAPCRKETPALERLHKKYKSQGLQVLGVNSSDTPAGAKGFIDEFKLTYPNVRDASGDLSNAYSVNGLPTTLFFDRQGKLIDTAVGALDETKLDEYIASLMKSNGSGVPAE